MTFDELCDKYRSGEVFIYGKSVIQIVDMATRCDENEMKTDFIYHTERNRRGIITVAHEGRNC
jgi:hypothetical protein